MFFIICLLMDRSIVINAIDLCSLPDSAVPAGHSSAAVILLQLLAGAICR